MCYSIATVFHSSLHLTMGLLECSTKDMAAAKYGLPTASFMSLNIEELKEIVRLAF